MHAIAHGGVRTHIRESALKVDSGKKKSLATPGNRTSLNRVPVRRSINWATSPSHNHRHHIGGAVTYAMSVHRPAEGIWWSLDLLRSVNRDGHTRGERNKSSNHQRKSNLVFIITRDINHAWIIERDWEKQWNWMNGDGRNQNGRIAGSKKPGSSVKHFHNLSRFEY